MKSYTDIHQSKKLAEILPKESADQTWEIIAIAGANLDVLEYWHSEIPCIFNSKIGIPCWSLAALLDIFPCSKESPIVNLTRGGWNPSFAKRWFATWEDENKNVFYSSDDITSVDAIVKLILILHKQKLI